MRPERFTQIATDRDRLQNLADRGWTPTHTDFQRLLDNQADLIREHMNRRNR